MASEEIYSHDVPVRFYKDPMPSAHEVVMANFTKVDDMFAEVKLPEYSDHQAIIPFSELSRRRIKRSDRTAKLGQKQPCLVTKVDKIKGYIDVSKTKIDDLGIKQYEAKYAKNSLCINIVKEFYKTFYKPTKFDKEFFEELCAKTIWCFDDYTGKKGSYPDFLKKAVSDESVLDMCPNLTQEERSAFYAIIQSRLSPKAVKIRSDIEVICRVSGVRAIIQSLVEAKKADSNPEEIRIAIVSPPKYFIELSGVDKKELEERLMKVIKAAKTNVEARGGTFSNKEPKIIGAKDDKLNEINEAINEVSNEISSATEDAEEEIYVENSQSDNDVRSFNSETSSSIG